MRLGKATPWLWSIVLGLAAGLLAVMPTAAHAIDTGTPRVQIALTPPVANFLPSTCSTESYQISTSEPAPIGPGGGIDYTPYAWYATAIVTDAAGRPVGDPYSFGSATGDSGFGLHAFPVCPDSATGTWTVTVSYHECEDPDLACASTDPAATYTSSATFLVVPPVVTAVEVPSVDYTARTAVVTSQVSAESTLPASTRLVVQKKSKHRHWKDVRTVAPDAAGHVSTVIKRAHRNQHVRFYLPPADGVKSSMSRAVKIKERKH
jgi:hypothetical protein